MKPPPRFSVTKHPDDLPVAQSSPFKGRPVSRGNLDADTNDDVEADVLSFQQDVERVEADNNKENRRTNAGSSATVGAQHKRRFLDRQEGATAVSPISDAHDSQDPQLQNFWRRQEKQKHQEQSKPANLLKRKPPPRLGEEQQHRTRESDPPIEEVRGLKRRATDLGDGEDDEDDDEDDQFETRASPSRAKRARVAENLQPRRQPPQAQQPQQRQRPSIQERQELAQELAQRQQELSGPAPQPQQQRERSVVLAEDLLDHNDQDLDSDDEPEADAGDPDRPEVTQMRQSRAMNAALLTSSLTNRRQQGGPRTRTFWTADGEDCLINQIRQFGAKWKDIENAGVHADIRWRDNVQIKDKAHQLKFEYLKGKHKLPRGFETFQLKSSKRKELLEIYSVVEHEAEVETQEEADEMVRRWEARRARQANLRLRGSEEDGEAGEGGDEVEEQLRHEMENGV